MSDPPEIKPATLAYQSAPPKRKASPAKMFVSLFAMIFFLVYTAWNTYELLTAPQWELLAIIWMIPFWLLALFILLILLLLLIARVQGTPAKRIKTMARLYDNLAAIYSSEPHWTATNRRDLRMHRRICRAWTREFQRQDFRVLANLRNSAWDQLAETRRLAQCAMLDPDGRTLVLFTARRHRRRFLPWLLTFLKRGAVVRAVTLSTRLSDGHILLTRFPRPISEEHLAQYLLEIVPWEARISALVYRHHERIAQYLAAHPQTALHPFDGLAAVTEFLNEESRQTNALKQARGFLTVEELPRLLKITNAPTLEKYSEALRVVLAQKTETPPPPPPAPPAPCAASSWS